MSVPLLTAVLVLTACGSSTPAPGSSLTVNGLVAEIKTAADKPGTACPIAYDIAAAGGAAGLTGPVSPADDAVKAITDSSATADDFFKKTAPAGTLRCSYKMGDSTVHTLLAAVNHTNSAISPAMPQITFWVGGDHPDLVPFIQQFQAASPGTPIAAPGNKVAAVRLKVATGDALLTAAVETSKALTADQIGTLAKTLAAQVH